jgi:flagellin-like hook-associated protein FlgL
MEHGKSEVADVCPTTASGVNEGEKPQPVHRKPVGLTITVEKLDRVLADIDAQMEMLQRERTSLGLVRGELAYMEARWSSA